MPGSAANRSDLPESLEQILQPRTRPLFITGTDTEIGKTHVTSLLARRMHAKGFRVGVYKPVASGCVLNADGELVSDDAVRLWESAGRPETLSDVCPQRFLLPLAPPAAAAAEKRTVNRQHMIDGANWWLQRCDLLLVEGAGGLMSPLDEGYFNADLAYDLDAELLIVAGNKLGTINHTLLTTITAGVYNLSVLGIILNQISPNPDGSALTNGEAISSYAKVPLLATIPFSYND